MFKKRVLLASLILFLLYSPDFLRAEGVDLRIVDETAPAGGLAVVLIELTEPQPISGGQIRLFFQGTPLSASPTQAVILSSSEVSVEKSISTNEVDLSFTSPDATFGTDSDLPILVIAIPVAEDAVPGQEAEIMIDLANSIFENPDGVPYAEEFKGGVFTVGGFSITDMAPASGTLATGDEIVFKGVGFEPNMDVNIEGADIDGVEFVSQETIVVTLGSTFEIKPTTRVRFRNDNDFEEFVYPAIFSEAKPNQKPLAVDDFFEVLQSQSLDIQPLLNDEDPDGDALELASVSNPANGQAMILSSSIIRYLPNPDFVGTDTFSYTIEDSRGGESSATVSVDVLPAPLRIVTEDLTLVKGTVGWFLLKFSEPVTSASVEVEATPATAVKWTPGPVSPDGMALPLLVKAVEEGTVEITVSRGGDSITEQLVIVDGLLFELPLLSQDQSFQTGLAITNRSAEPQLVRLRAWPPAEGLEPFSIVTVVEPNQQVSQLLAEFHPFFANFSGWLEITSQSQDVSIMFLNLKGPLSGFAGSSTSKTAREFVLPISELVGNKDFRLALVNNQVTPADLNFVWFQNGTLGLEKAENLLPLQSLVFRMAELFPEMEEMEEVNGYVRVTSTVPISAFQQFEPSAGLVGLRPPSLPQPRPELVLPQSIAGGAWDTELIFINTGQNLSELILTLRDDEGIPINRPGIVNPVHLMLASGQMQSLRASETFQIPGLDLVSGSLTVSGAEEVVGFALLSHDTASGPRTVVPFFTEGSQVVFSQAGKGSIQGIDFFSGLALVNLANEVINGRLEVFSGAGTLLGEREFVIAPGGRLIGLLSELVADLPDFFGGHIFVQTDHPVAILEIFGESQLRFLSTVEGRIVSLNHQGAKTQSSR